MPKAEEFTPVGERQIVVSSPDALEAVNRAELDVQIVTARQYPRDIDRARKSVRVLLTMDADTAAMCFYAIPRAGKEITGPSVRFAEEVCRAWGSMRTQTQVIGQDKKFLTAQSMAMDLEANIGHAVTIRRRITDSSGRPFNDDMVGVTSNAAIAIARRNAILTTIPWTFWRPLFSECMDAALGNKENRGEILDKCVQAFRDEFGVTDEQILALLGVPAIDEIGDRALRMLRGTYAAIKNGEISVESLFRRRAAPATEAESDVLDADFTATSGHDKKVEDAIGGLDQDAQDFLRELGHVPGMDEE